MLIRSCVSVAFLVLSIGLPACSSKPTAPEKPPVSDIFKTQVLKLLEEGAKLNAKSDQGVKHAELDEQLASVKGAYDLAQATWPATLPKDSSADFDRAIRAWDLALTLWKFKETVGPTLVRLVEDEIGNNKTRQAELADTKLRLNELVGPTLDDVREQVGDLEKHLTVREHGFEFNSRYWGQKFLPCDANIRVLLGIAGESFNSGKTKVLAQLQ